MAQAPQHPGGEGGAEFVRRIVADPKSVPDVMQLTGYLGASSEEGHERLYLSADLSSSVDIPTKAILHRMPVPAERDPHGAVTLWVRRDAELIRKLAPTAQALARYFAGAIQGAAAAAAGAGTAAAAAIPPSIGACTIAAICTAPTRLPGFCTHATPCTPGCLSQWATPCGPCLTQAQTQCPPCFTHFVSCPPVCHTHIATPCGPCQTNQNSLCLPCLTPACRTPGQPCLTHAPTCLATCFVACTHQASCLPICTRATPCLATGLQCGVTAKIECVASPAPACGGPQQSIACGSIACGIGQQGGIAEAAMMPSYGMCASVMPWCG